MYLAIKTSAFDWLGTCVLHTWKTAARWSKPGDENASKCEKNIKQLNVYRVSHNVVRVVETSDWN